MYQLIALPSFTDNYIWLLEHTPTATCLVVDPGTAEPVKAWLSQHPKVQLTNILITHHHPDHIGGISELKQLTGAQVYGPSSEKIPARDIALHGGEQLTPLHDLTCQVLAVPGHTLGHIAYLISDGAQAPWLFCGDTLFSGGCGRLFEGTPEQMQHSLTQLSALPDNTLVCCAHEYTASNLRFAAAVEPDNPALAQRILEVQRLRAANLPTLPSTIALERATNPFLRSDSVQIREKIDEWQASKNQPKSSNHNAFALLRQWKNEF